MERRRTLALLVAWLLLAAAVPAVSGAAHQVTATGPSAVSESAIATKPATAATPPDSLDQRFVLALSPEPGEIRVRARYRVPNDVTSLEVSLGEHATVRSTNGFRRTGEHTYDWTRSTDTPSITYAFAVNRTVERGLEGRTTSGYLYVDTGDWAIAPVPRTGLTYSGFGQRPPINTTYGFDTPGATGGDIVYLGPHRERQREVANQRLRLVVPRAAELTEPPAAVLSSVGEAASSLAVGPRDREVVAVAAPTGPVTWGSTGLQRGASDFWVLDDQRVSTPDNVWVHEYVHTRQVYRPADATRWTVEGTTDYYATLAAYRQGRIDYERFRSHLQRGRADRYDDTVLAEPSTWRGTLADYDKGALVLAALDRKIRQETDGGSTLQDALRRINGDDEVSQSAFLDAVEAAGGTSAREFAERYTETAAAPETWTEREHRRTFADGAAFAYEFSPPYDRHGPYRDDVVGRSPTLIAGESLTLPVAVENRGSKSGEFQAVLSADGETVATRTGTLASGERTTVTFERTFDRPGEVRLTLAGAAETVTVRLPADVAVTALDAPRRLATGETATVRATVAGATDRPAAGTVNLTVDGERVAAREFHLGTGETGTVSAEVSFDQPGEYTLAAGSRSRTVRVTAGTPTTPRGDGSNGAGPDGEGLTPPEAQPGFGAVTTVVAAGALTLLLHGRRE